MLCATPLSEVTDDPPRAMLGLVVLLPFGCVALLTTLYARLASLLAFGFLNTGTHCEAALRVSTLVHFLYFLSALKPLDLATFIGASTGFGRLQWQTGFRLGNGPENRTIAF